jgi:hypothetical protein
VLGSGWSEQPQAGADHVIPRRGLGYPLEAGNESQCRRRGVGLQLQPSSQRRQPERHLVQTRGVASPAEPETWRVHQRAHLGGDVAVGRWPGHRPHGLRDNLQGGEVAAASCLQGPGRVVDLLAGIRVGERLNSGRGRRQVLAQIEMRRAANRPDPDQLAAGHLGEVNAAVRQRPPCAVRTTVLYPDVQNSRFGELMASRSSCWARARKLRTCLRAIGASMCSLYWRAPT